MKSLSFLHDFGHILAHFERAAIMNLNRDIEDK